MNLPDNQQRILDTGVIYTETAAGNCNFGEVFTTDGRIAGLDLTVVEDPGVNIVYNVSVTMLDETSTSRTPRRSTPSPSSCSPRSTPPP